MTDLLQEHPVWDELRRSAADEFRAGMAQAWTDDVRPDWEAAAAPAAVVYDGLTAFAIAYRETAKALLAGTVFGDIAPCWSSFTAAV